MKDSLWGKEKRCSKWMGGGGGEYSTGQDEDQDSLLVKRRNDNHSPGIGVSAPEPVLY